MSPENWRKIREIVGEVLECAPGERAGRLDELCRDEPELRGAADELLEPGVSPEGFLEPPIRGAVGGMMSDDSAAKLLGERIGPYRLKEVRASGGMGNVYRAVRDDGQFEQEVAVKIIKRGMDTDEILRRFRVERQTLAQLNHANIAQLLDGGSTPEGRPYLVMEYIAGEPIDTYCRERGLNTRERVELFLHICAAVHYAHQHLVVHRDLKPANILVTAEGEAKLLDFGVAKVLSGESALQTRYSTWSTVTGTPPMTPEYASPEQVRGEAISTASDVYSLGMVLYELLTGQRAYRFTTRMPAEIERVICTENPPRPSTAVRRRASPNSAGPARSGDVERLCRSLQGDLDTIVLKALRKESEHRYASVEQFADDLRRHLEGMPVLARKASMGYRTGKFVSRHKGGVIAGTLVLAGLIAGLVGNTVGLVRTRRAELRAQAERDAALSAEAQARDVTQFLLETIAAANPYRDSGDGSVVSLLIEVANKLPSELGDQPEAVAALHLTIGKTFAKQWRWDQAMPHLEAALQLNRELYGDGSAVVADCLSVLGRARSFANDPQAVAMQEEALAIRKKLFGAEHEAVAESMGNLGFALWLGMSKVGVDFVESAKWYQGSIDMYRRLGLISHPDLARFTFSFGVMSGAAGEHERAEEMFREAMRLYRELPASEDIYKAQCANQYSRFAQRQGRSTEAVSLLEDYLKWTPTTAQKRVLSSAYWRMAVLKHDLGKWSEAESWFRRALQYQCAWLAESREGDSERMMSRRRDFASLEAKFTASDSRQQDTALYAEAIGELRELETKSGQMLGPQKTDVASALIPFSRNAECESSRNPGGDRRREKPYSMWVLALCESRLGDCLAHQKRHEEAEPFLLAGYDVLRESCGADDWRTVEARESVTRLYESCGDSARAAAFRALRPDDEPPAELSALR